MNETPTSEQGSERGPEYVALAAFRAEHRWEVPEGTSEATRKHHPPEDILDRLRQRYTADEVPSCRVCGGELSVQSMGGGRATEYAHSAPDGVRMGDWMEHYRESKWTQYRAGDDEVLALLDFIEQVNWPASTPEEGS